MGFFVILVEEKLFLAPELRVLVFAGFLGGFTTFSTFIFETTNLIRAGQTVAAFLNILASVCVGFLVFRLGILLGKAI